MLLPRGAPIDRDTLVNFWVKILALNNLLGQIVTKLKSTKYEIS